MVNLKIAPFSLSDEQLKWVEDTIASMTIEEKIGQLFVCMCSSTDEKELKSNIVRSKMGGVRYMNKSAADILKQNTLLQKNSRIPLLIASNVENGGAGACTGGTNVGQEIKIAATNDTRYAYKMGQICGKEAAAIGSNWAFAPIVDLQLNWRNPIISTRTFSSDAYKTLSMAKEYFRGVSESNVVCAMKHFPGDGVDERDHHLSSSVNSLSCEEWDESFGKIYKGLIDEGIQAVMAGHIMQPAYQKHFNPLMSEDDILPASLCKELLTDLLREKLGFNGLIVTDASHMVGMTGRMARSEFVPKAIAAGCDMFLFFNDIEEDTGYMRAGIENGVISEERLSDALHRILGLKAALGMNGKGWREIVPSESGLSIVGCAEHKAIAAEIADKAITLVKQKGKSPFPLTTAKYKRIMLVPLNGGKGFLSSLIGGSSTDVTTLVKEKLEKLGFEIEIYESNMKKLEKLSRWQIKLLMKAITGKGAYGGKNSIETLKKKCDLVLILANVDGMMQVAQRINWNDLKGGWENPWYVNELPTVFVSLCCPFHLADVPQVKNYINCYDSMPCTVEALIEKLTGKSEFTGVSPVDAFCGMPDTRI